MDLKVNDRGHNNKKRNYITTVITTVTTLLRVEVGNKAQGSLNIQSTLVIADTLVDVV